MNDEDVQAWAEQTERLQNTIYKLASWHGIDISELIEAGYLLENDLD